VADKLRLTMAHMRLLQNGPCDDDDDDYDDADGSFYVLDHNNFQNNKTWYYE
jgi:hypothetical protein